MIYQILIIDKLNIIFQNKLWTTFQAKSDEFWKLIAKDRQASENFSNSPLPSINFIAIFSFLITLLFSLYLCQENSILQFVFSLFLFFFSQHDSYHARTTFLSSPFSHFFLQYQRRVDGCREFARNFNSVARVATSERFPVN